ncbi:MAG: KH domain-containing protein, partial [Halobacteriota archaeon]
IYTFNRQVVTVPIDELGPSEPGGMDRLAANEIERELQRIVHGPVEVERKGANEAIVYVPESDVAAVIGSGGSRVQELERTLGVDLDIRPLEPDRGAETSAPDDGRVVSPEVTGRQIVIPARDRVGETVEVHADGDYIFTATVGRDGEIKVTRGSAIADELERAINAGQAIRLSAG